MNTKKSIRQTSHQIHKTIPAGLIFLLIIAGCFTIAINMTSAATYYVDDANGNDSNPGTSEQPWKTLGKPQSTVTSGDTVLIRNGAYGQFKENNISHGGWITYKATEGHSPEVTKIWITSDSDWKNAYLIFDGLTVTSISKEDAIRLQYVTHVQFLNCNIVGNGYLLSDWENKGFNLRQGVKDITIDNCTIHGAGDGYLSGFTSGVTMSAITRVSENINITNCDISECSLGIFTDGKNIKISNNNIHKLIADGIVFSNVNGFTIENNRLHDLKLYIPTLVETPTETTWNADGTVMTNPNAQWNTPGNTLITTGMEIDVVSGTNALIGDGELHGGNFAISSVSADGKQITLSKGIADGGQPSEVNYYIKSSAHADLIQAMPPAVGAYDVTIRNNQLYDSLDAWSFMHLEPLHNGAAGFNWLIENNLCWNYYTKSADVTNHPINLRHMNGLVFRNNTVIGRVQIRYNTKDAVRMSGNIISVIEIYDSSGLIDSDYNIITSGRIYAPYSPGVHSTLIGTLSGEWITGAEWNDPKFTGLFKDYANGDFRSASASSLAVGHGDPNNHPATDILGVTRKSIPDAGCYEYTSTVLSFAPIGNKEVNEGSTLTFVVDVNDPNMKPFIKDHNLPSEPNFANNTFNWTPTYNDAGNYEATFVAQNDLFEDFETIGIIVNNINRSPVLAAIGNKSVSENSLLNFLVSATDPDGDSITYSAEGLPSGAAFASQTFNWTPNFDQAGTYQVKFTASDGQAQDSQTINLIVNNVNRSPMPAATGGDGSSVAILLNENFDDGDFTGWSIRDEGTKACPSSWSAASGTMVQKSNIYTPSSPNQPGTYALYKAGTAWTNYRVSLTMKSGNNNSLGVMFRYKDNNNYYRFSWDNSCKLRQVVKKSNGRFVVLCMGSAPYVVGRSYQLDIAVNGTKLQVFINNSLVLQATDSSLRSGSIALYSWANAGSYFDNIVVQKL